MSVGTTSWLASLHKRRVFDLEKRNEQNAVPIAPWIAPPLHPDLQQLLLRIGKRTTVQKKDKLISSHSKIHHLVMVTQGVTARNAGTPFVTSKGSAIAMVGHIAFGNLNFFTNRAAIGHYYALTKAELIVCDKEHLWPVLKAEPELFQLLIKQFEYCTLSDRLGFTLYSFASVEQRLKAFVIGWAMEYAEVFYEGDEMWLKMPTPLTRGNLSNIVNASTVSIDSCLTKWKKEGKWHREEDVIYTPVSFFEETYHWLRLTEEPSAYFYPHTLKELFAYLPPPTFWPI